ncbi:hypothetical protein [Streptomonospora litoralis]|uniref:Uncharacterized protein n=1 Tax=Streptomonospora litoralis TaxID=2498135 RepID=A0A4P6Q5Q1_9ACTN|nr:hypothetical protein [Streptomonospora litoralis]QBI56066.1 hypothetical protein EKD16_21555 [Streptomonospora litoralis]
MGDVLSALLPPAVVAAVFCTFVVKLLRKEMAPRTSDGRLVSEADPASRCASADTAAAAGPEADSAAGDDGAKGAGASGAELRGDAADQRDR